MQYWGLIFADFPATRGLKLKFLLSIPQHFPPQHLTRKRKDWTLAKARDGGDIVNSYRPLIYMFSKQHETTESVKLLGDALNWCALAVGGACLDPGVVNMDHSSGFMQGISIVWVQTGIS